MFYERFGGCQIEQEKLFRKFSLEKESNNKLFVNSVGFSWNSEIKDSSSKFNECESTS